MNNRFPNLRLQPKKVSFLYPLNLPVGISFYWLPTAFCLFNFSLLISEVQAQIVPDSTLPVNSIVTPANNRDILEGGTQAGGNLFHSFQQFSVPTGREAFFNNGLDIQNIFTRVTGNSISNIDGLISANGTANLFLLNPNGIIFGPNAKLNIGGSFLASTANSFKFSDGTEFNAKNPQTSPVLTVNVPVGLQYGGNTGDITIKGQGQNFGTNGISGSFSEDLNPLEVNAGNTLAFVGGNIIIDGGILQAPGGRVELGGLAGEGIVGINIDNNNITSLGFPDDVERSDILITNKAGINTNAFGGGSITIAARNIDVLAKSVLTTGISSGSELIDTQAGDIALNATGSIAINASRIDNIVSVNAKGDSGEIIIKAKNISLTEKASLNTDNQSSGVSGNITVSGSNQISLENSSVTSKSNNEIKDNYSEISILSEAGSIFVNNSELNTTNSGNGYAGDIIINARDLISIADGSEISSEGNLGRIFIGDFTNSEEEPFSPEEVRIDRSTLKTSNQVTTNNDSTPSGGSENSANDGIVNELENISVAGDIIINARDLISIANGSKISSDANQAGGQAGFIYINSGKLVDIKDSTLRAISDSGASKIDDLLDSQDQVNTSGNSASQNSNQPSFGGRIRIDAGTINLSGTTLITSLSGSGYAGSIGIFANDNLVIDNSSISSDANSNNQSGGTAGSIYITAGKLAAIKDSYITATSFQGLSEINEVKNSQDQLSASNILIDAGTINLSGTGLIASLSGSGYAGNIQLFANDRVVIENRSRIFSDAFNNDPNSPTGGIAGYVYINASNSIEITTNSYISAENYGFTEADANNSVKVGEISIQARTVSISDSALLSTKTFGSATAGHINIVANDSVVGVVDIAGENTSIYSDAAGNATGDAGSITINAPEVFIRDGARLITDNNGLEGKAGTITISTASTYLNNGSLVSSESASGKGGDINLISEDLLVLRGKSNISTSSGSQQVSGSGGNITINTTNLVALENSNIIANAFKGQGGQVTIDTKATFGARKRTREELRSLGVNIDGTNRNDGSNIDINLIVKEDLVTSDITAISEQGDPQLQGTVEISTPDVDPSSGLIELQPTVVDATKLAASGCRRSDEEQKNQFIVTGRGGLPPNPNEALNDEATWMDLRATGGERQVRSTVPNSQSSTTNPQIREAQGWKVNFQGQVELLAETSTVTPQNSGIKPLQCPAP